MVLNWSRFIWKRVMMIFNVLFQNYLNILYGQVNKKQIKTDLAKRMYLKLMGKFFYPSIDKLMSETN